MSLPPLIYINEQTPMMYYSPEHDDILENALAKGPKGGKFTFSIQIEGRIEQITFSIVRTQGTGVYCQIQQPALRLHPPYRSKNIQDSLCKAITLFFHKKSLGEANSYSSDIRLYNPVYER
ncbi:hypothetical protein [Parashewanella tropica]|uniref:hypothetical protein n=1 Tax=Parashewanella tropica TaxID=2547970 RepID=UPI0010594F29|nr:hypothetical protein [Parashewanella tropica]